MEGTNCHILVVLYSAILAQGEAYRGGSTEHNLSSPDPEHSSTDAMGGQIITFLGGTLTGTNCHFSLHPLQFLARRLDPHYSSRDARGDKLPHVLAGHVGRQIVTFLGRLAALGETI